jgi:hypothetical protein
MRRQEDRDAALAEAIDQLVDIARRDRVEPRRRLVEEQHLRVAQQGPRQGDSLTQPLRQRAAGVAGAVGELDGRQRAIDPGARFGHLLQVG